jgi:hypothetical protein
VRAVATVAAAAATSVHHVAGHVHGARSSEDDYVLLSKDGSVTMSGSSDEVAHVRALAGPSGEALWFRRAGREYVVRDAALLGRAHELFAPQRKLGAEQGELGGRQGALGAKQGALGAKQGTLGAKLGGLAARQASASEADGEKLEREQEEVSRQMEELGSQQEELGRQQEALGRQQEELGARQEKLGQEAEVKLKGLLDDALARGVAQEVS